MDIHFCKSCENTLFIYSDDEHKLYLGCKVCGEKEEYNGKKCVYSNEFKFDHSETINNNKYLSFDNTLPEIKGNKNIKCPNTDCITNEEGSQLPSNITYIKYNETEMKYLYMCKDCGQKWKNN
jgi:DNA-directed RNA polymerase subunit M/transcription elongation factor TFIIS